MKTVPIMQAQHNLSKVLRSLTPGERIAITRNKKIVAELVAPLEQGSPTFPDFAARAKATWGEPWQNFKGHPYKLQRELFERYGVINSTSGK